MDMKKCSKCGEIKETDCFYKKKTNHDGYRNQCKSCERDYYFTNKDKYKEYNRNYYITHITDTDKRNERNRNYRKDNKEKINLYNNKYKKDRKIVDELYKLKSSIRNSIYNGFVNRGYKKTSRTHEILGCSYEEFKVYIESQFETWMDWNNYGKYNGELNYGWDLDHIIPISSAKTKEEIIKLNHYTNFQPLCSKVNRDIKIDKIWTE